MGRIRPCRSRRLCSGADGRHKRRCPLRRAKVPGDTIQKFVSTKEVSRKILSAGGSVGLIGTINLNQKDDGNSLAETFDPKKKR